jgi:protein ImuA
MVLEKQEIAADLRRRLNQSHRAQGELRSLGHAAADACLGGGLKCAALHEIFPAEVADAVAASGFAFALASCTIGKDKWLVWVQQDFAALEWGEIFATGLLALGFDPNRLMIVKVPDPASALRAGADALNCRGVGAVVIEFWRGAKIFDLVASRKFTLAAARHGVTAFALRHAALPAPSTAETRWHVRTAPFAAAADWGEARFDAELLRNRHGGLGRWIMDWNGDGRFHETGAADAGAVFPAPLYRPPAPQRKVLRQAI